MEVRPRSLVSRRCIEAIPTGNLVRAEPDSAPLLQPTILSMEVDDENSVESEYRLQIGNQVRYLVVAPGTFDRDTLWYPLPSLPQLP